MDQGCNYSRIEIKLYSHGKRFELEGHRPGLWSVSSHEEAATQPRQILGPGSFSSAVIQGMCNRLGRTVSRWFSDSHFETGTLLADWKTANIVPIFKEGDRTYRANYRSVSLTSVPCKIMESIIKEKLTKFLGSRQLLCKEQHGFSRGRSCLPNLLETLENWTKAL